MIRYMLDTNACIGVINGAIPSLRKRLLNHRPSDLSISQIVYFELEFGICRSKQPQRNRQNLIHFLQYLQIANWSDTQSREAAAIRCELAEKGTPIGHYDTLIAGHARSLNTVLVTHNVREFSRVEGLALEDWEIGG